MRCTLLVDKIIQHSKKNPETTGMGTTLIIAWVIQYQLYIAWAGDSRAYLYRPSDGLIQISIDHSYVQDLVNKGSITTEQAFYHPSKHIITQSLGDINHPIQPDFKKLQLKNGDCLLLCSDGLNGMLTDQEIEKIISIHYTNLKDCSDALVKAAKAAGGTDNITIALADIGGSIKTIDSVQSRNEGLWNRFLNAAYGLVQR